MAFTNGSGLCSRLNDFALPEIRLGYIITFCDYLPTVDRNVRPGLVVRSADHVSWMSGNE